MAARFLGFPKTTVEVETSPTFISPIILIQAIDSLDVFAHRSSSSDLHHQSRWVFISVFRTIFGVFDYFQNERWGSEKVLPPNAAAPRLGSPRNVCKVSKRVLIRNPRTTTSSNACIRTSRTSLQLMKPAKCLLEALSTSWAGKWWRSRKRTAAKNSSGQRSVLQSFDKFYIQVTNRSKS